MEPEVFAGQGLQPGDDMLQTTIDAGAGSGVAPAGQWVPPPPAPTPLPGSASSTAGSGDNAGGGSAPPPVVKPLFVEEEAQGPGATAPEPEAPRKWNKAQEDGAINLFLNLQNIARRRIGKMSTGDPDYTGLELTEEEMEELGPHYRPLAQMYGNKIPWYVWLIGAHLAIDLPKVVDMNRYRKTVKENRRMMEDGEVPTVGSPLASAAAAAVGISSKTRRKFTINAKGYYQCDEKGGYLRKELCTVKASLADIDKIVRDTPRDIVARAFPNVDLSQYPPEDEG